MCNKVGIRGGGSLTSFIISTPIDFCYYSHACSCPNNMTLLYHFILYCIALYITGMLIPYQCLYDLSISFYCIALLYVLLVCVLVVGSRAGGASACQSVVTVSDHGQRARYI